MLFGSSVMENIRFGKPEATDAEVISAAKQANAHRFITSFPDGYGTVVGMVLLSYFFRVSHCLKINICYDPPLCWGWGSVSVSLWNTNSASRSKP